MRRQFVFVWLVRVVAEEVEGGRKEGLMDSEAMAEEQGNNEAGSDKRGKYRIMAEIKRLEQDSKFLEEELEELERIQDTSTICKELLLDVEARPDALLPVTRGPANPVWNRWFEGPQDPDGCRCRIM